MEEEEPGLHNGKTTVIHRDPKNPRSPDDEGDWTPPDRRTILRKKLTPYLPPPVVSAIRDIDPLLDPYVGAEASITVASSLLLCFLVRQLMKALAHVSGGGEAIANDDVDPMTAFNKAEEFRDTVILCGPIWAGKTRIFYHLCHRDANLPTVMSLRANAATMPLESRDNGKTIRVLDYPGHSGLQDALFLEIIKEKPVRFVLVVDSTQALAPAADCLFDLLQHAKDTDSKYDIFVACHKSDLSTSKNPRRIKISIRTELEKLIEVRSTKSATKEGNAIASLQWWTEGEALDLDDLKYARLQFKSTTCSVGDGIGRLEEFCRAAGG